MTVAERIFDVWSPADGLWSPWVKPVLFAHLRRGDRGDVGSVLDASWAPPARSTAVVIDLPGASSVQAGWALAERGYRPVPLFNAAPSEVGDTRRPAACAVDVEPIMLELQARTPSLAELRLPADAPPAFMLDSRRGNSAIALNPGCFDNRSISFPTDFPSANFMLAHGITTAIVCQLSGDRPLPDLAHTLLRWQEAGIEIKSTSLASPGLRSIVVSRPSRFRSLWHRVFEMFGFRKHTLGGYGGTLPEPSSG